MRKLYLKGCKPSPTLQAAKLGPGDEVWTLNNQLGRNYDRKWDATPTWHFSLHGLRYEVECHGARYLEYLSEMPWIVYLWEKQIAIWDEVAAENGMAGLPIPAKASAYPLAMVEAVMARHYFTGSFAYMMAIPLLIFRDACSQGVRGNPYHGDLPLFDEVHIVGTEFNSTDIRDAQLKAADLIERGDVDTLSQHDERLLIDNLRGQGAGDESWARECMMYWAGRLEQAGIRVVTDEDSWLFHNKWLDDHAKDCSHGDVRGLYGLDPCIGG